MNASALLNGTVGVDSYGNTNVSLSRARANFCHANFCQGDVMSVRNRLVLPVILSSLVALAGCGGGGISHVVTPPPTGGFTNSDLNGTYVFSVTGSDFNFAFLTMVGTLTADGNGTITGGALDLNDPLVSAPVVNLPITGGSYSVTADGRGQATLTAATPFGSSIVVDFVLATGSHGLITEFDGNATGSGTLDLQSAVAQNQIAGSYAFNFTGISLDTTTGSQFPYATVGAFTLDANGNVTSGVEDLNDNGSSVGLTNLAITSGSVSLATVPGLATLTTSAGTLSFDVYPIDATHLKFIEIDALTIMVGDAFPQASSIPTGANVFTISGLDSVQGPFTAAGLIVTDGAGTVTNASAEDINDAGVPAQVLGFTGSYTPASGGRSELTLTSFANGNNGGVGNYLFAAYPSTGGTQLLEIDNAGVTAGVAYPQTSTTLASGGYGFNLTGINAGNGSGSFEEDAIAQFTNTGGTFTGLIDFNDQGIGTSYGLGFGSTFAADGTIPGRGVITPTNNAFNLISYVVDNSTSVFVEVEPDGSQLGLGSFTLQPSAAKSNLAVTHLATLHLKAPLKHSERRKVKGSGN